MITGIVTNNVGLVPAGSNVYFRIRPAGAYRLDDGSAIVNPAPIKNVQGQWSQTLELGFNISPRGAYWEVWENIPGADRVWACYPTAASQQLQQALLPAALGGTPLPPGLKPYMQGLSDMNGYPFVANGYPYNQTPYSTFAGTGDYRATVLNQVATVFWKDLQPTSQGQAINPSAVNTVAFSPGGNEQTTGVALGLSLAQVRADARANGYPLKIRVEAGWFAPTWVKNLAVTTRNNNIISNPGTYLVDSAGNSTMPFWISGNWDPNNPHAGFAGAYYDLQTQLALLYDLDSTVVEVTISGSLTQNTAEPLIRELNDNVALTNWWYAGLGPSTSVATDDTDIPAVNACIKAHMAAWRFTRSSFSCGPHRVPSVNRIVHDAKFTIGSPTVTSATANFSAGTDNGVLVATDPTVVPGGTTITVVNSTTATMSHNALQNTLANNTMGIFNNPGFTTDHAIAGTTATNAATVYGAAFFPGNTSYSCDDALFAASPEVNFLISTGAPFWLQTPQSGSLQQEVQSIQWSHTGGVSFDGWATLGGSFTLTYAGQTTGAITGWTNQNDAATAIATALNALGNVTTDGGVTCVGTTTKVVQITWTTVKERTGTLITVANNSITGPNSPYTGFIIELHRDDTLLNLMTTAATLTGVQYLELHPGYGDQTTQPCATPAEMAPYIRAL